ncbi:MAG: class I poly(R)-hydroxyalkanoic acid synthase [Proteobacteria bacterium]|nr:class I poly(R)-hydroxyalkanoic acid synthase [Pseudomonadota bacterium]
MSPPPLAPSALVTATERFASQLQSLWSAVLTAGTAAPPEIADHADDRRFAAHEWHTLPYFSWLRQSYLLYGDYLRALAADVDAAPHDRERLRFVVDQYLDAIAPTNFVATNPEVVQRALATDGASLVQGMANLADDALRGRISQTDREAFEVGRNLATTPGSVVYRNELIELIQYAPSTPTVFRRPLVMVPPCINKFYILDLTSRNSFVRHAVAQGHTVFMVSWRNIPAALGALTFDDYIQDGVLRALAEARAISGSRDVNALGFCVGGTLLAAALAVLAARHDTSVASVTLLTTLLDFTDPGPIGVYLSPEFLAAREPALLAGGRLLGNELACAFSSLRANDLVWNYVVNNYLKGQTPPAFDLLYWNGDSTNLPGPMYAYYLREMYLANRLREPGALTIAGAPVDLRRVRMPAYVFAAREDHIVPWRGAYRTTSLLGGDTTFVLGASGHIAGVVNPPEPPKRNFWTNELVTDEGDDWFARATATPGSWWPHWHAWLAAHGGTRRKAPARAGDAAHPVLDAAPGRYVRERD